MPSRIAPLHLMRHRTASPHRMRRHGAQQLHIGKRPASDGLCNIANTPFTIARSAPGGTYNLRSPLPRPHGSQTRRRGELRHVINEKRPAARKITGRGSVMGRNRTLLRGRTL
jgi:hypothetical protein